MKVFKSISEYIKEAKQGDYITFGGRGLMDGLKADSKHDVFKLIKIDNGRPVVKAYRGRTTLTTRTEQEIGLYSQAEFNKLPVLW